MLYSKELNKVLATIKKAGNSQKCTISTDNSDSDEFSGEGGAPTVMVVYFAQVTHNNNEIQVNPSLVEAIKIIVCPLKDDGTLEPTFLEQCKDKTTRVELPDGKTYGVKLSRITSPDNVTPIVARLSLGG